jgi:alpha-D-ribose 1-methylphosphonate 5-phosphate C-P lyase
VIQTRHRIPERPLTEDQIIVFQVPEPEPLRRLSPEEAVTRKMHAFGRYGLMYVRLYEDISRLGHVGVSSAYPILVNGRYLATPSPIPKFDNPKLHRSRALAIFGAGRERRIHAIPPFTDVKSLDFVDYPFEVQHFEACCSLCGAEDSYLDEILLDVRCTRDFVCSDTAYCAERRSEATAP